MRAVEILELTPETYRERSSSRAPLMTAGGAHWNNQGLGHLEAVQFDEKRWLAYVTGRGESLRFGLDR